MSTLIKHSGVPWLLSFAIGILLAFAPTESFAQTTPTCSSYQNWVQGQYYAAGAIVRYSDGKLYRAKYENPGYNPTISTYYWEVYYCSDTTACTAPNWVQGQYYAAGAIVKYSDGKLYRAKYGNPGYNPTISTYYWAPYTCSGTTGPTPTPTPAPAGAALPLPFRLVATYHPLWTEMRITSVPTSYNQIYLFHAVPSGDGSGRAKFEYGYVVNSADIATVRGRGQRVVLTFGGANLGFNFSNRTQSQNFVTSIIGIINTLGGQVDGLDFNNFEAHVGSSSAEMVWIAQQLKAKYGSNFSISCPPAPDGNWAPLDRQITKAMADAGVLDYAGPQFYDHYTLITPEAIERWIDEWVAHFNGDASKVVIGFGANYSGGSSLSQVQTAWTRLKQKYPNIRGGFGWSSETDRNAGWTFGNYLGNNK